MAASKLLLAITATLVFLLVASFTLDLEVLLHRINLISPQTLLAYTILNLLAQFLKALRWKALLVTIKNPIDLGTIFWITNLGSFVNILAPIRVGGELLRPYLLQAKLGMEYAKGLSSVGVERLLDLVIIAILALFPLFILPQIAPWLPSTLLLFVALFTALFTAALLGGKAARMVLDLLNGVTGRMPIPKDLKPKVLRALASLLEGIASIASRPTALTSSAILTLLVWLVTYLSLQVLLVELLPAVQPSPLAILAGSMIFQLSFILPAPPGHLGSYEAFFLLAFLSVGLGDVEGLLVGALLSHSLSYLLILALGYWSSLNLGLSIKGLAKR